MRFWLPIEVIDFAMEHLNRRGAGDVPGGPEIERLADRGRLGAWRRPLDFLKRYRPASLSRGACLLLDWTPGWEAKVAAVLLRLEEAADADDRDLERELLPAMRLLPDQGGAIAREVFAELLPRNQDVHHLYHTLPGLVGRRDAEWLAQQPGSERLI